MKNPNGIPIRTYRKIILIPSDEAAKIQATLNPNTDPKNITKLYAPNTLIVHHTAVFNEHYHMDIRLYASNSPDTVPWTEAVLCCDEEEQCRTKPTSEFFGGWELTTEIKENESPILLTFRVEVIEMHSVAKQKDGTWNQELIHHAKRMFPDAEDETTAVKLFLNMVYGTNHL